MALNKEEAKEEVKKLVKDFLSHSKEELNSKSENQIKSEFIDPLFSALGWDMRKEAVREERILKGRADYILKTGNHNFLVIEAKKTSIPLAEDEGRQAVSYAYHNQIKFAVLTNFKQMRVYHALSNIRNIDKNLLQDSVGYLWINCENYESQFDRLWLLSKESFQNGTIFELLSSKDKRLAKPINESLLADLLKIREWLSKELKAKKNYLEKEKIDEIVQILIDRLIFIRSVEDRGLEANDYLQNLADDVRNQRVKLQLFPYLLQKFEELNKKYDSKLFENGLLDKEGAFSDEVLFKVINGIYYGTENTKKEKYMFNEIPGDLLGSIYEQYLGTILKESDKRVKLEAGKGKRKSMGIYYTPAYIVDYIVKNTVGECIKHKSVDEIMEIKILDPACGSGSFLVRAFNEVCVAVENRLKDGKLSKEWTVFKSYDVRLNLGQKIAILMHCIYGVDLDEKAVELARLNLLLKLLEDEGQDTKKLLLPHLSNIKCGNSLIDDTKVSDKAFNWQAQFPDVFKQNGFDVIIGNPPYGATVENDEKIYLTAAYSEINKGEIETFGLFYNKVLNLIKKDSYLGFITPDSWFTNLQFSYLRNKFVNEGDVIRILDTYKPFQDAKDTRCCIFIYKKDPNRISEVIIEMVDPRRCRNNELNIIKSFTAKQTYFKEWKDKQWHVYQTEDDRKLIKKVSSVAIPLSQIAFVKYGLRTGNNTAFVGSSPVHPTDCKLVSGSDIERYSFVWHPKYLLKRKGLPESYFDDRIKNNKIVVQYVRTNSIDIDSRWLEAAIIDSEYIGLNSTTMIFEENRNYPLKFLLALINSRLMNRFYKLIYTDVNVKPVYLSELPIVKMDGKQVSQINESATNLVNQMIELQKKSHNQRLIGHEKEHLDQQIRNVDYQIDQLVYQLYNITEDEKKIIEESLK